MDNYTDVNNFDEVFVLNQLSSHKRYNWCFPSADTISLEYSKNSFETILMYFNRSNLVHPLLFCMQELVSNANKANCKRLYFEEKKLDLNNETDYQKGMQTFTEDVFLDFEVYKTRLAKRNYSIHIDVYEQDNNLVVSVQNKCPILKQELAGIAKLVKTAKETDDPEKIKYKDMDTGEGKGLGLILSLFMLKKMGLENAIKLKKDGKSTTFIIIIPYNVINAEKGKIIAQEIIKEIDEIPQFPEAILRIQKELNNPNCNFNSLADIIKADSNLTAEVIRIANSPIYAVTGSADDLLSGIKIIGLNGLKNLIMGFSANKILLQKYQEEKVQKILKHSYEVALYSSHIAKLKKMKKIVDDVFISAVIHDFGKILIETINPQLVKTIEEICRIKDINVSALEDITEGYNHAVVGAKLAQKWNFPEIYRQSVLNHHRPQECDKKYKSIVYTIYLGNELFYYFNNLRKFESLDYQVLKYFNIAKKEKFERFTEQIQTFIEKEEKNNI